MNFFRLLLFSLFLSLNGLQVQGQNQDEMKIIYVYDALCGWCYGFSPVMVDFAASRQGEGLTVEVLSGGMITGAAEGPLGRIADYIRSAYPRVEATTGVKFGPEFTQGLLNQAEVQMSSWPSALALTAFKSLQGPEPTRFAAELQKLLYQQGKAPDDWEAYAQLALSFGLSDLEFRQNMESSTNRQATQAEFERVENMGIQGFPAVLLEYQGQLHLLTSGYASSEELNQKYQSLRASLLEP